MERINKIDFAVIFKVKNANPNGDPLNGNRPRTTYNGIGEVSDVCLKRKIRNRLMDQNIDIFVQSDENVKDDCKCLRDRYDKLGKELEKNAAITKSCKKWYDVRAFGHVFAYPEVKKSKNKDIEEKKEVSIGIRGPVTIQSAFSIEPVEITSTQITKSVNNVDSKGKSSDTMGMKHRVDGGVYCFFGAINSQLATKTGFSFEDVETLKTVLPTIFENDASSARPEGSMNVLTVIWWNHNCINGKVSSGKIQRSLTVNADGSYQLDKDILPEGVVVEEIPGY